MSMVTKAISVHPSTDGQMIHNLYGFNLIDIISRDEIHTDLILNDLVSLEIVNGIIIESLVALVSPRY